jgi:hypothetical protein
MATKYSEEPIREAVIIVPPFFSQAERKVKPTESLISCVISRHFALGGHLFGAKLQ